MRMNINLSIQSRKQRLNNDWQKGKITDSAEGALYVTVCWDDPDEPGKKLEKTIRGEDFIKWQDEALSEGL